MRHRLQRRLPVTGLGALLSCLALAALARAQRQFDDLLVKAHLPFEVEATPAAALGDVDADGDLDLVLANIAASTIWLSGQNGLFLNDGNGWFTDVTATSLPPNIGAFGITFGDIEGDGDLDIFLAVSQVRLLVNDGSGVFEERMLEKTPPSTIGARRVVVGDVDGDGDLDAAVAARAGRTTCS